MNEELIEAHRRQLERLAELEASGEAVGGWKLGQTSGESRDAFGPGVRAFGYLLASRILASGAPLDWSRIGNGGIENEVCFVVACDVTEPVTPAAVRDALAGVAPAFEINQRRIPKTAPTAERIADDLANWGIVVGDVRPLPRGWHADAMTVALAHEGRIVASVPASGHIDDHFESLARLANQLLPFGRHLKAGDRVITGAFGRQDQPDAGVWSGEFGPELGTVTLRIES
ncbi:MAG: 2-keto-4-pentenoate hydratase [Pseudomonadales bacterium]